MRCLLILMAFVLTGCAQVNLNSIQELHSALSNLPASDDANMARWVAKAEHRLSLRLAHLAQYPETLAALKASCSRSKNVQLLLSVSESTKAQTLKNSCIKVFLSEVPMMDSSSTAALLDGSSLIVDGNFRSGNVAALTEEFRIQRYILNYSHPL